LSGATGSMAVAVFLKPTEAVDSGLDQQTVVEGREQF
jgi:hypothetical protein